MEMMKSEVGIKSSNGNEFKTPPKMTDQNPQTKTSAMYGSSIINKANTGITRSQRPELRQS
jgi:hypothetical protein